MSEILTPEEIRFLIASIPDVEPDHPHIEDVVQRYAALRARLARAEEALRGFLERGQSLGASHPHFASYITFPDEVWTAARAYFAAKESE